MQKNGSNFVITQKSLFVFSHAVYHKTMFQHLFQKERNQRISRAQGQVTPDPTRCVQCGICSFNCPVEIDVRRHAWQGEPVVHSHCLTCGECVARCPRGVLAFERTNLFAEKEA